ncbi:TIGR02996 domain-containing protein [Lignipirellula cremea]|uniref:Leucine Rich repeats (2 copies) n=1 Tax=Lignipirellula cremea TaxID=2528010 RepID=A0A518DRG8_9BACT|nr:TIGR02996 domain-containing protein [Lignipirellula cremea]QDU94437.1 Leucine Rich repeats (2 copies) [Lignipirellula cremea]
MNHLDALLMEIVESPDEDHPRLVFADYLEDRGDPRGEFVRVQCELATGGCSAARQRELELREADLLAAHRAEWIAAVPPALAEAVQFRRGFIEHLRAASPLLTEHADAMFRVAPTLSSIDLDCTGYRDVELANWRHSLRITELSLRGVLSLEDLKLLGRSRYLPQLRSLALLRVPLAVAGARELAASTGLKGVQTLRLDQNALGDAGVQELAAMKNMPRLTSLRLFGNEIGTAGARAITLSPRLGSLTSLSLFANSIGNAGVQSLAVNASSVRLRELDLACTGISNEAAEMLASSRLLQNLKLLDLRINFLSRQQEESLIRQFGDRVLLRTFPNGFPFRNSHGDEQGHGSTPLVK